MYLIDCRTMLNVKPEMRKVCIIRKNQKILKREKITVLKVNTLQDGIQIQKMKKAGIISQVTERMAEEIIPGTETDTKIMTDEMEEASQEVMTDVKKSEIRSLTAIKVHYLMIQIAHIIRQLLEKGIKEIKELKLKLKEISQNIKTQLISKITNLTVHIKRQLRFD